MGAVHEANTWSTLPREAALDILTAVLELLDERILIADHNSCIRYVNQSYRDAYAASCQKIGIGMEGLLGQKISVLKGVRRMSFSMYFKLRQDLKKNTSMKRTPIIPGLPM